MNRMTIEELAHKLRDMRRAARDGDGTATVHLFGIIFGDEIGYRSNQIAKEYLRQKEENPQEWPGKPSGGTIQDGKKLAEFVEPHYRLVREWRD